MSAFAGVWRAARPYVGRVLNGEESGRCNKDDGGPPGDSFHGARLRRLAEQFLHLRTIFASVFRHESGEDSLSAPDVPPAQEL